MKSPSLLKCSIINRSNFADFIWNLDFIKKQLKVSSWESGEGLVELEWAFYESCVISALSATAFLLTVKGVLRLRPPPSGQGTLPVSGALLASYYGWAWGIRTMDGDDGRRSLEIMMQCCDGSDEVTKYVRST